MSDFKRKFGNEFLHHASAGKKSARKGLSRVMSRYANAVVDGSPLLAVHHNTTRADYLGIEYARLAHTHLARQTLIPSAGAALRAMMD